MEFKKFVGETPSDRNAIDIFAGRWACALDGDDVRNELEKAFQIDARPRHVAEAFGSDGRLDGVSIMELGPLEAGHTYSLEQLGAEVTAVEGNAEAYLKCLIVKEVLGMKSRFRLGSFLPMLESSQDRYDIIFASGVLYHMPDPIRLIRLISEHTNRAYFWTHYHDRVFDHNRVGEAVSREGIDVTYYRARNENSLNNQRWWGGLDESACWMDRDDILRACRRFGFNRVEVVAESPPGGPVPAHFSIVCSR